MSPELDLLILGGGCAGLSLAMQLAQYGNRAPNTLILEQRTSYANDRTWCFWGDETTPFAAMAAHQWPSVRVQNAGKVVHVDCSATPYRMLDSGRFYDTALAALATADKIHLQMDAPLKTGMQFRDGRWHVETPAGSVSAAMVVDTRPIIPEAPGAALLWQSFYGKEIDCAMAVFEPGCVELMDFLDASPDRVAFTYVLPMSSTRALIELTVFSADPLSANALSAALDAAVAQRVKGAAFTVRRSEQGILPMGLTAQPTSAQGREQAAAYVRAGLFAGAARPATGYAFQRIQRWAADCAAQLATGGLPVGHRRDPRLLAWMDNLFLNVIRHQPQLGPALFVDMFNRIESQKVIRFLSDKGSFSDYIAMMLALPAGPFLRQLCRARPWR
jgi:lycopene beta-cyclase